MLRLLLLLSTVGLAADWPRFRGPNGSGVATDASNLPVTFGPEDNLAWKAAVPFGRSSPIVAGGRVIVTGSEGNKRVTLAFDAVTGKPIWRREVEAAFSQTIYKANDPASPTPAADESGVYAFFSDFGIASYGLDGRERWRHKLGRFENFYGISSSPVPAGGLVFLQVDQIKGSYLLALESKTGRLKWKVERPESPDGWGSPIVHGDQLIVVGSTRVDAFYRSTGERAWWIPLQSNGSMGSPVIDGENLIVTASGSEQPWMPSFEAATAKLDKNGDRMLSVAECKDEKEWFEHFGWVDSNRDGLLSGSEWETARSYGVGNYGAVAIPLGGKGPLDASVIRWRVKRNLPYVPAPVLYGGTFFMVKDGGIVTSLNPATGAMLKQGRTEKAPGPYFASPVAADGKVFLLSEEGKLTVLKAAAQWEVLTLNNLGEECYATPAISGNRIFVRTRGALLAFGGKR